MGNVAQGAETARPRRVRSPQDLVAGMSLVVVALFALWAASDLEVGTLRSMGPGMLPRAAALLVGAMGLLIALLAFVLPGEALGRWPVRGPVFLILGVVAFALTIRTVGLAVAGPLVALVSGAASPETRPRELLLFAVAITVFCIGLFRYALNLPIPVLIIPGYVTL
jgi:hypothetical protein